MYLNYQQSRKEQTGVTLIELMVALVVASILVMGIYSIYTLYFKSASIQDQVLRMQQNARVGIDDLEREIRMAGLDVDGDNNQPVFVLAAPYDIIFNANLDVNVQAIDINLGPNQVPVNPDATITPYQPSMTFQDVDAVGNPIIGLAETVRWTLDSKDDGLINSVDQMINNPDPGIVTNPALYRLYRQAVGFNGVDNFNPVAVAAEWIRGPDPYPDSFRPSPLFSYWIGEDRNDDGILDVGEDINGSGFLDEYLWGDDGSGGETASDDALGPGEIEALMTGSSGGPRVLDNSGAAITVPNGVGDTRVANSTVQTTLVAELGRITRVIVAVTTETATEDPDFTNPDHGAGYGYREQVVTTLIQPRRPTESLQAGKPSVVLTASPQDVACPSDSTTITTLVRDSAANPLAGITVNFSATSGSFNSTVVQPTDSVDTDSLGNATTSFYNLGQGAAAVSVSGIAEIGGTNYIGITKVLFVSGPPNAIALAANPQNLPADGVSTSTVTASVVDECGNPVADDTSVSFQLKTIPPGVGGSVSPPSSMTSNGSALTTVTATTGPALGTVTANTTNGIFANLDIAFTSCNLVLVPTVSTIPGDGLSSTTITATLKDLSGNLIPNATIDFTTTEGTLNPTTGTTDLNGQIVISITSSPFPHVAAITGTVTSSVGSSLCDGTIGTTQVQFTGCYVNVVSTPSSTAPSGQTTVDVTMTDSETGAPLPNIDLTFSTDNSLGTVSPLTGTTDGNGQVSTTFTAESDSGSTNVFATATCGDGSVNIPIRSCNIVMAANPGWIKPDGISTSTVTATLTDTVTGNLLANEEVTIMFDPPTALGTVTTAIPVTTDSNGQVTAIIQSAGTTPGTATLKATTVCGESTLEMIFSEWTIDVVADPTSINTGGQSTLTANIYQDGVLTQPPNNESVTFSFVGDNLGAVINPPNPAVPTSGVATTTLTSGIPTGTVTVRASVTLQTITLTSDVEITITLGGNLIIFVPLSAAVCDKPEKVSFRIENLHDDTVTIKGMDITWDHPTGLLDKIKTGGTPAILDPKCGGGSDLWKANGCGGSGVKLPSPASIDTTQCQIGGPSIPSSSIFTFNEVKFKNGDGSVPDMRGTTFTIRFNYTLGSDPTLLSAESSFTVP